MKVVIDIPGLENHQDIRWDTDIRRNFKPPCPCDTGDTLHGFPFKGYFAAFEKSGEPVMQGIIPCMCPTCTESITFTMWRDAEE